MPAPLPSPTIGFKRSWTAPYLTESRNAVVAVMAQEYGWDETLPEDHVRYVLPAMVEV